MAVFPLAGQDGHPPALVRLYLLQEYPRENSCARLCFTNAMPENCAILLAGIPKISGKRIEGDSWQLAAALARVAVDEPELRVRLGANWVCTGALNSHGKVTPVELGNKAALAAKTNRRWLLPDGDNIAQWRKTADSNSDAFGVRSLTEAATYVREYGVLTHQFQFRSQSMNCMCCSEGNPTRTGCEHANLPRKLCLWHSKRRDQTPK